MDIWKPMNNESKHLFATIQQGWFPNELDSLLQTRTDELMAPLQIREVSILVVVFNQKSISLFYQMNLKRRLPQDVFIYPFLYNSYPLNKNVKN